MVKGHQSIIKRVFKKIFLIFIFPLAVLLILELILFFSPWAKLLGPGRFHGALADHSLFCDPDNIIRLPIDADRLKGEFRSKEVAVKKNACRIICLGGSSTYGWPYKNDPSRAYPAVLEQLLNSEFPNKKYEVINAGVGGYTSYQALYYFEKRLYKFNPDLVTICFGANDSNNNSELGILCSDKEYYETLLTLSKNKIFFGTLRLLDNSRIYALLEKSTYNLKKLFIKPKQRVSPFDFKENLEMFIKLSKIYNFKLLFIFESHINLNSLDIEIKKNPYYNIMFMLAKDNPERVQLVDTISLLRRYNNIVFYDRVHPTPCGHKLIAELIIDVLKNSNFIN